MSLCRRRLIDVAVDAWWPRIPGHLPLFLAAAKLSSVSTFSAWRYARSGRSHIGRSPLVETPFACPFFSRCILFGSIHGAAVQNLQQPSAATAVMAFRGWKLPVPPHLHSLSIVTVLAGSLYAVLSPSPDDGL